MSEKILIASWWGVCIFVVVAVWVDAFGTNLVPILAAAKELELAAWIQAIGSIAAIFGAAYIASYDRRAQARQEDVAALEVTSVVFEQAFWLARRAVLKLPCNDERLLAAQSSWERVKTQWVATVDHVRRLTPLMPEQFNAQLVVASRLQRAVEIYEGSLGVDVDIDDLLELDKAVGRACREIHTLDAPFANKGARGPTEWLSPHRNELTLQLQVSLALKGANIFQRDCSQSYVMIDIVVAPYVEFFRRRVTELHHFSTGNMRLGKDALSTMELLTKFAENCLENQHHHAGHLDDLSPIVAQMSEHLSAALKLNVPADPGG